MLKKLKPGLLKKRKRKKKEHHHTSDSRSRCLPQRLTVDQLWLGAVFGLCCLICFNWHTPRLRNDQLETDKIFRGSQQCVSGSDEVMTGRCHDLNSSTLAL